MGPFDHGNTQKTDLYQTSLYCTPQWKWGIKILFVIFQKRYPTWTTCSLAVPVKSWTVSFLIITMHQQEKLLEYKLLEASHNKSLQFFCLISWKMEIDLTKEASLNLWINHSLPVSCVTSPPPPQWAFDSDPMFTEHKRSALVPALKGTTVPQWLLSDLFKMGFHGSLKL